MYLRYGQRFGAGTDRVADGIADGLEGAFRRVAPKRRGRRLSSAHRARVAAALQDVEAELRAAGLWDIERPSEADIANAGAFGTGTMGFEQWLRWVLVPRAHAGLENGTLPRSSQAGVFAAKNLEGPEYAALRDALDRFDSSLSRLPAWL